LSSQQAACFLNGGYLATLQSVFKPIILEDTELLAGVAYANRKDDDAIGTAFSWFLPASPMMLDIVPVIPDAARDQPQLI
jgi:hypothetical protein